MSAAVTVDGHRGMPSRHDKIRSIFDRFDGNGDGFLDREEMAALVTALNPRASFTADQISSIIDEVFRSYSDFIHNPTVGLPLLGLVQTYDDGAGDVDHDFAAIFSGPALTPEALVVVHNSDPNPHDSTRRTVEDLEILIRGRPASKSTTFRRGLKELRARIDDLATIDEVFDGHMGMGRTLVVGKLFAEAVDSFRRAVDLKPIDVRPHYLLGNALMSMGKLLLAKHSYSAALKLAEEGDSSEVLPQVHVNLGIVLEGEGLLISASEHYREAAILCPTHYRALKLLGSALFGRGEYVLAEKALEEALLLRPDFADAHCDLGSVLWTMGHEERAIFAFQKAIDLRGGDHVDALYNLGGLFMAGGRYQSAAEMYARVLAIRPDHWQAHLNRAVPLLGNSVGMDNIGEARRAVSKAFELTSRVELYDAIRHLKKLEKKPGTGTIHWVVEDAVKFKLADGQTTERGQLVDALWIRELQKATKLGRCSVNLLKKEMEGIGAAVSHERSIRKSELEVSLRKLLHFLRPETFQSAVKAIDEKIWAILDGTVSGGKIDYRMFFAIIAPICEGSPEKRKRAAFDALAWPFPGRIDRAIVGIFFRYMRVVYFPSQGFTDLMGIHGGEGEDTEVSFHEFLLRFDDADCGFGGVMSTLLKLEDGDRAPRGEHSCGVCQYQISGLMFKETTSRFFLCSTCYSQCKVPLSSQKQEYKFRKYHLR